MKRLSEAVKEVIRRRYVPGGETGGGNVVTIARAFKISERRVRRIARSRPGKGSLGGRGPS